MGQQVPFTKLIDKAAGRLLPGEDRRGPEGNVQGHRHDRHHVVDGRHPRRARSTWTCRTPRAPADAAFPGFTRPTASTHVPLPCSKCQVPAPVAAVDPSAGPVSEPARLREHPLRSVAAPAAALATRWRACRGRARRRRLLHRRAGRGGRRARGGVHRKADDLTAVAYNRRASLRSAGLIIQIGNRVLLQRAARTRARRRRTGATRHAGCAPSVSFAEVRNQPALAGGWSRCSGRRVEPRAARLGLCAGRVRAAGDPAADLVPARRPARATR